MKCTILASFPGLVNEAGQDSYPQLYVHLEDGPTRSHIVKGLYAGHPLESKSHYSMYRMYRSWHIPHIPRLMGLRNYF